MLSLCHPSPADFSSAADVQSYSRPMVRLLESREGEGVGLTCGRGWKKEGRSLRDKASTAVLFVPAIMHCWDCKVGVRHVKQETAKQVSQYLVFRSSLVYHSQLRTAITWSPESRLILVIICCFFATASHKVDIVAQNKYCYFESKIMMIRWTLLCSFRRV